MTGDLLEKMARVGVDRFDDLSPRHREQLLQDAAGKLGEVVEWLRDEARSRKHADCSFTCTADICATGLINSLASELEAIAKGGGR